MARLLRYDAVAQDFQLRGAGQAEISDVSLQQTHQPFNEDRIQSWSASRTDGPWIRCRGGR